MKKIFKNNKFKILLVLIIIVIAASFGIPSLARVKNRTQYIDVVVWDGSIAESYRSGTGTSDDPYIISNGAELAYLSSQLEINDYKNIYFKINNDIVLNEGVLSYDNEHGLMYVLSGVTYYIKEYTNEYYSEETYENKVGELKILNSLNNFKGTLIGDSNTIYGLYMFTDSKDEIGLFENLNGTVKELYLDNILIYGGNLTGGLASTAKDANIEDVLVSGYVIGNTETTSDRKYIDIEDIDFAETIDNIAIEDNIRGNIISSKITGNVNISGATLDDVNLSINGERVTTESFEIDLGTSKFGKIPVSLTNEVDAVITLSEVVYDYTFEYTYAAGIIAETNNVNFKNVINKATVISSLDAAGITANASNTILLQTYNTGKITGEYASGLISDINYSIKKTNITNSYNAGALEGTVTSGIVNSIYNNLQVTITNTFDTTENSYFVNEIIDTSVVLNNDYSISSNKVNNGTVIGTVFDTTMEQLKTKSFGKGSLSYDEFVDLENMKNNVDKVWMYPNDSLPILYLDDISNPLASLHVSRYTWTEVGYKLKDLKFNESFMFSINEMDALKPLAETYYYIHNSKTPLTKSEIDEISEWQTYGGVTSITEQGFYIIYAKVVDYNGVTNYVNSDLLILDLSGSEITISFNNKEWTEYSKNPKYTYISSSKKMSIEAYDELSGLNTLEYYVSNSTLSEEELKELESWTTYKNELTFDSSEPKVVYVKAVDNCDFVTYASSDFISLNGYTEGNILFGSGTTNSQEKVYITNKSSVSFNFTYTDSNKVNSDENHSIISNILLPKDTVLTVYDNTNKEIYTYTVPSNVDNYGFETNGYATYSLSLFKNRGKVNIDESFVEANYNGESVNDNFKVTVDFAKTNINTNIENIKVYMAITKNNEIVRNTLDDSLKQFSIYSNVDDASTSSMLFVSSDYSDGSILLNSDSSVTAKVSAGLTNTTVDSIKVIDTSYENKQIGLMIKIFDSNGNQINKRNINNLVVSIDGVEYAPDQYGVFRINLNNGINTSNKDVVIRTTQDNIKIPNGTYYLKITSYAAFDGMYSNDLSSEEISIPIIVSGNQNNIKYNFNVSYDDDKRIISKTNLTVDLDFELFEDGPFVNPNIRISLYQKEKLTAYDQNYIMVDLQKYVNEELTNQGGYIYYASASSINGVLDNFEMTLITSKFNNTGYKFVFELYDGDTKIGTIEKKFIVR